MIGDDICEEMIMDLFRGDDNWRGILYPYHLSMAFLGLVWIVYIHNGDLAYNNGVLISGIGCLVLQ